jgi:hypothetical protein
MSDKLEIRVELAQRILDYLVARPFGEVHQLVRELQALAPATTEEEH